jgi:hypothetical protein
MLYCAANADDAENPMRIKLKTIEDVRYSACPRAAEIEHFFLGMGFLPNDEPRCKPFRSAAFLSPILVQPTDVDRPTRAAA